MQDHLIYNVQDNGDLMWLRHLGADDGSFKWDGPNRVGNGWGDARHVFGAGNGVIYAVTPLIQPGVRADTRTPRASGGDLMWYRHAGRADGSFKWDGPCKVATGWGALAHVFSGGDGIVYGITPRVPAGSASGSGGGELVWWRHVGQSDGSARWEGPKTVDTGWGDVTHAFSGGDGVIYAIKARVEAGVLPDGSRRQATGGDLLWYRHVGRADGSVNWQGPCKVGRGWGGVRHVFAGGDDHALALAAAQAAIGRAWDRLGGPKSVLGLPRGSAIDVRRLAAGYAASFRAGDLHLLGDGSRAVVESHDVVDITLVAIECQMRQETEDEVYGTVSVIGAAGGTLATARFPGSDTLAFADGQRIARLNLPLLAGGIVQNYTVVATLVENDSGDVDAISRKLSDKVAALAAKGLGALTGVPAESVADSESFKDGIVTGLKFLLGDVFGIGDDPYNPDTFALAWHQLSSARPPPIQPTVHNDDDPRTIDGWTHRVTLTGKDDGGDRGQYALYFRVDVSNVMRTIQVSP